MTRASLWTAVAVVVAMAGCGDNFESAGPDAVSVDPTTVTLEVGATSDVTATFQKHGVAFTGNVDISWESNNPGVVSVAEHGASATLTAVGGGTATITASGDGLAATVQVTVSGPKLTGIEVAPAAISVPNGATTQIHVNALYSDNSEIEVSNSVTWATADAGVATVTDTRLTGHALGTTMVTATYMGQTATGMITVVAAVPRTITIAPAKPTIAPGATLQLTATENFTDGSTLDVTATAAWTSSTPATATIIGATGLATAVAAGTTTITATKGTIAGTTLLTVAAPAVTFAAVPGFAGAPCRDAIKLSSASDVVYVCTKAGGPLRGAIAGNGTITFDAVSADVGSLAGLAIGAHPSTAGAMAYTSVPAAAANNWFRSADAGTTFPMKAAVVDSAAAGRFLYVATFLPMVGNLLGTWDPNGGTPQAILLTGNQNPPTTSHVIGSATGAVHAIAGIAANNIYVGVLGQTPAGDAATGGIFHSTDSAVTWTETDTGIAAGDKNLVMSVVADPTAAATLYAGLDGGGQIYKSTDAGATWTASATGLAAGAKVAVLYVSPVTHTTVYAATSVGLYRSTDSGATWSLFGFQNAAVTGVAQSPTTPALILVSVDDATGLYRAQ